MRCQMDGYVIIFSVSHWNTHWNTHKIKVQLIGQWRQDSSMEGSEEDQNVDPHALLQEKARLP